MSTWTFLTIIMQEELLILLSPFHYRSTVSYFQHLHFRHRPLFSFHCPTTFTGSTCKRNFSQDQRARRLLTGSICKRNFSQDQHAWGTSPWINMQEELFTGSTCIRNFSQDQHAPGTSHRINMQPGTSFQDQHASRNFSQDQHASGTSHRINMHQELLTGSTCKRNSF